LKGNYLSSNSGKFIGSQTAFKRSNIPAQVFARAKVRMEAENAMAKRHASTNKPDLTFSRSKLLKAPPQIAAFESLLSKIVPSSNVVNTRTPKQIANARAEVLRQAKENEIRRTGKSPSLLSRNKFMGTYNNENVSIKQTLAKQSHEEERVLRTAASIAAPSQFSTPTGYSSTD